MSETNRDDALSYVEWIANSEPMVNPDVVEGLTPPYCFYCDGDWAWVPGYDGPLEVWVVANHMVNARG